MIPFFVADRPISLEILKGFFAENLEYNFGILTHAFTSKKFKEKFKLFPYSTPIRYSSIKNSHYIDKKIEQKITKFVDSGIFHTNREISYEKLFEIYSYLEADYGVIIDFIRDKDKTLESAKIAMEVYKKGKYKFKLVGVAQGVNVDDYLMCYESLKKLGYKYIALGGLLTKTGKSNYIKLSCEMFLISLLEKVNMEFNPKWIFTLGIYNPSRHRLLEAYNVWGADYKGWLFEYEEDYSFIMSKLGNYNIKEDTKREIIRMLNLYIERKKTVRTRKDKANRIAVKKDIINLRQSLDNLLKKEGLSLQMFRIKRVRENLTRRIVENNLKRLSQECTVKAD